jgi:hypothetical protein
VDILFPRRCPFCDAVFGLFRSMCRMRAGAGVHTPSSKGSRYEAGARAGASGMRRMRRISMSRLCGTRFCG